MRQSGSWCLAFLFLACSAAPFATSAPYMVNPGDILLVAVWNEEALSGEVLVRPDGFISLPIAGEIDTNNRSPSSVAEQISDSLARFMKDKPRVIVSLREGSGNTIYVLGKVARPGAYKIVSDTDVMQALALAGGLNEFAAEGDIRVLRRRADGEQEAIRFDYSEVKKGKSLASNIILRSRDIVVVP